MNRKKNQTKTAQKYVFVVKQDSDVIICLYMYCPFMAYCCDLTLTGCGISCEIHVHVCKIPHKLHETVHFSMIQSNCYVASCFTTNLQQNVEHPYLLHDRYLTQSIVGSKLMFTFNAKLGERCFKFEWTLFCLLFKRKKFIHSIILNII